MITISKFTGPYKFLSNFHPVDILMPDGLTYPSAEHAYQALKTDDLNVRSYVRHLQSPTDAKRFIRSAGYTYPSDEKKLKAMEFVLVRKFREEEMRALLLNTGDRLLVEGNTWGDVFWGQCNGHGQNHLGQILMAIRSGIRRGRSRYL